MCHCHLSTYLGPYEHVRRAPSSQPEDLINGQINMMMEVSLDRLFRVKVKIQQRLQIEVEVKVEAEVADEKK